jgi:hypothetical protein
VGLSIIKFPTISLSRVLLKPAAAVGGNCKINVQRFGNVSQNEGVYCCEPNFSFFLLGNFEVCPNQ